MKHTGIRIIKLLPLLSCLLLCSCSEDFFYIRKYEGSISGMETESSAAVTETRSAPETTAAASAETGLLHSPADIQLHCTDGDGKHYGFTYAGAAFQAVYTPDNWKVIDSYLITNSADIVMICEALKQEHPIHGADMQSERTASDMAYEWGEHNFAYALLPADSPYRANAKDVDINPADQGKSAYEMFLDRRG